MYYGENSNKQLMAEQSEELVPDIKVSYKEINPDLKERLKRIIDGIQRISPKIKIKSVLDPDFSSSERMAQLLKHLAEDKGCDIAMLDKSFDNNNVLIIVYLPDSLLSDEPNYYCGNVIIFCGYNKAFFFDYNMEVDQKTDTEGLHNIYSPNYYEWGYPLGYINQIIRDLATIVPDL